MLGVWPRLQERTRRLCQWRTGVSTPSPITPLTAALEDCRAHREPKDKETTKATMKMKKSTLAIPAAAAEIPVKPNKPAMIETMKKNNANLSILSLRWSF